eukprot:GHVS01047111.1.p1 GENE.GHVS01047111.1~~GHVS01047111.1.p1  ORF type:complete len:152 (+),score=22.62 GHVS01047111.1:214-669(+)
MDPLPTGKKNRLVEINEAAEDVLYHKQHIISLQSQANTFREGMRVYRKERADLVSTSGADTSVSEDGNEWQDNGRWLAVANIFVKLQDKAAVEYLNEGKATVEACSESEGRKRRTAARRLAEIDPDVTEIPAGTLQFLLAERKLPQEPSGK